jgi:branched-chain amino acid transport system ATP-binding protein
MTANLLDVQGLGKRFGGFVALDGIDLTVAVGERVGLIGPNGSGKSTLVNCLTGTLGNYTGAVRFDGGNIAGLKAHQRARLGMARSFQLPRPFVSMSVADNIRIPLLYAVNARPGAHLSFGEISTRCSNCWRWWVSSTKRTSSRAISLRSKCASSSLRGPWRPSLSC